MKQQKGFFEIYHEMKLQVINDLIHKLTKKKDFRRVEELLKMKVELENVQEGKIHIYRR